jgi:hypothetical protein
MLIRAGVVVVALTGQFVQLQGLAVLSAAEQFVAQFQVLFGCLHLAVELLKNKFELAVNKADRLDCGLKFIVQIF